MADRIHQPYRAAMCPLLPLLLPLAGHHGVLGVALSGAGPSVLLILSGVDAIPGGTEAVAEALAGQAEVEVAHVEFERRGGLESFQELEPRAADGSTSVQ
jgi:homoserine kinase